MKKCFTLSAIMFLLGIFMANAQSTIPGSLDLSTTTVEEGTGNLHGSAGWNGSNIDWMQGGNIAKINFTNTKAGTAYNIISYAGTPNTGAQVNFVILDANGSEFYNQTCTYVTGGWGDHTKNATLPTTNAMPAGDYTLVLNYISPEGTTTTVNIYQIEFVDASQGEEPKDNGSLNIPGKLNANDPMVVIEKNCSWGSTPSVDDEGCFNWLGDGDVVTFPIVNTKKSAYAITFETATPCEPVTIDFLIIDANGNTVYANTANVTCTGENGGDWAFKPAGHNTSLPNTNVLEMGNYTLKMTFHQGLNYENFTTNIKDITFTAVESGEVVADVPCVFLHGANFDKDNSTNDLYQFTDAKGFTLTMNGRDINKTPCNWTDPNGVAYTDGINFKNNDPGTINVPAGQSVYAIAIGGCSQSDNGNLCYLYTVDKDGVNVFTDGIGQNEKDNGVIQGNAKYPMFADGNAPQFALIDFTEAPAATGIKVVFSGNNQEDVWFKLYTTLDDANKILGKESQGTTDNVIYSWESNEGNAIEKGGQAVASDGVSVNYANNIYYTIRVNSKKADVETNNVTITFDQPLQTGDKIAVTGYKNKNDDGKLVSLFIQYENGATFFNDDEVWTNICADDSNPDYDNDGDTPNTNVYTVGEDANGSKSIKMARSKAQTNLFITKIQVTRGGENGIQTVKTATRNSNVIYNLAGMRVDSSYKGIVIKNGKKYVQK